MSAFLERLRRALAPDYEVVGELGSGGMGTVYLARHVALDKPVAVKVLRPELATAAAVERFVREAQILANVRHPHIVPVHNLYERDGLHLYTMDYLAGDTLESRLTERGRLRTHTARKMGRDLLDALGTVHGRGVIHRDVKPANIFLVGRLAVLTDFGIARRLDAGSLTDPGVALGTAAYMAPEQLVGIEATARTDLYAAGMVIYEALTARRWDKRPPDHGDWSLVPWRIARVLRRALELEPQRRWPDAVSFRHALWWTRVWPYIRNTIGVAVGSLVLGIALDRVWEVVRPQGPPAGFEIRVEPASAPSGVPRRLTESLACGLARRLDGYPDLRARCTPRIGRVFTAGVPIRPRLDATAGGLRIRLESPVVELGAVVAVGRPEDWLVLVDSIADGVFGALLGTRHLLDRSLPAAVLPKTREGLFAFRQAEGFFGRARWGAARAAYATAAALDSNCWLCYWRHAEVGRWMEDVEDDPRDSARYLAHAGAFPGYYQSLMRAERLPEAARLDSLDALTHRWRTFLFGQFRRGDELFHRGPFVGRSRGEARAPFEEVLKLQPGFAPALQHVAWLHIAEGDSADATTALGRLEQLREPIDSTSAAIALVELAYAWRFLAPADALRRTEALMDAARAVGFVELDAGARYLPAFGAPAGALAMSERLLKHQGFERSASLARVLALVGVGRPDTAVTLARALARRFPELRVFADELVAVLLAFDADSGGFAAAWPAARRDLAADAALTASPAVRRRRAAWMLGIVEQARGVTSDPARREPVVGDPAPHALVISLQAATQAARGAYGSALATTDSLTGLPAAQTDDPFFRTVLHLARAQWSERAGHPANAGADLLWSENSDVLGYPTGDPQPAEVDWAFGPLAQWRAAALTERLGGPRDEACRAYAGVVRSWSQGEPRYRARADSAARRRTALSCKGAG